MLKPEEVNVILYHGGGCPDGFGSAWAAYKALGHKAIYLPVNYGEELPEEIKGANVAIIDFSYKRPVMESLISWAKDYIVIDHHESAQRELEGLDNCIFDMNHSGCVLSWNFFHPGREVPDMLLYVEDRDLWKWKIKKSEHYLYCLDTIGYSFDEWDKFSKTKTSTNIAMGSCIADFNNRQIERAVKAAKPGRLLNTDMMVVNITDKSITSKALNELAKDYYGVALGWYYDHEEDVTNCSFRSDGRVNVAKLAEKLGGGGHFKASGARLKGTINQYLSCVTE